MIDVGNITQLQNYNPVPVNRYVAKIFAPISLPGLDTKTLSLRVESAELPGKSIPTSDARLYGPLRKIPYNLSFIDSTFTFMCSDNYMIEKRFFDEWANYIVDENTFDVEYYDNLVGGIELSLLDNLNEEMYVVEFREVFPLNVSAINVGFGQMNDHAKFSVTFSYRKWRKHSLQNVAPPIPTGTSNRSNIG